MAAIFASLFAVFLGTAARMVWLSFRSKLAPWIQSFRITQVAIAVVQLDTPRPQIAALFIFSVAAVLLLGLAIHEAPFELPVFVPPGPIKEVLRQVLA